MPDFIVWSGIAPNLNIPKLSCIAFTLCSPVSQNPINLKINLFVKNVKNCKTKKQHKKKANQNAKKKQKIEQTNSKKKQQKSKKKKKKKAQKKENN